MKKTLLLTAIAILVFVGLNSCQQEDTASTQALTASSSSDVFSINYQLPTQTSDFFVLGEASEVNNLTLGFDPHGGCGGDRGNGGGMDKGGRGRHHPDLGKGMLLGRILYDLSLTEDQKTLIRGFCEDYMDCMKAALESSMQARMEIVQEANTTLKSYLADYKAGTITKVELRQKIKDLNTATKALLDAIVKPDLCPCLCTFFDNIKNNGTLTAEQLTKWDAWVQKLIDNKHTCLPCDTEN